MDDRPLMGMRSNLARAVLIIGEAHMTTADTEHTVVIGAGPWQGEYTAQAAAALLTSRYGLFGRDGALGMTREAFRSLLAQPDLQDSQIAKDNAGRVFTRVVPKRIQAWDFSKAPIGRPTSS